VSSHPNPSPHLHPRLRPGRSRFLPVLALAVLVAATAATFSQSGNSSPLLALEVDPYPNFDIRTVEDSTIKDKAPAREYLARFAAAPDAVEARAMARVAGIAALESAVKGVDIQAHPALKATEVVSAMPGTDMLTGPSDDRVAAFREFLTAHADAYGVSAGQVAELDVVADYANPAGNMSWVEFEQRFNGIPVFQGLLRGGFTAKGELARTTGVLATGIDATALASVPSVSAAQAVSIAAANVGWDVPESVLSEKPSETANHVSFGRASMAGEPSAWLVYFPLADGVARLAWATQIIGDPYGFLTVVDGETGTILFRKNLTNFQSQSGSYNVYPSDSPAPASPSPALPGGGYQALYVPRQTFTLIGNEAPNTFNNLGWMTDGANETAGNNVRAGLDLVAPDGIEATVTGTSRVFNFAYDPETAAPSTANYRSGEVTDMFYWTNRYHDSLYLLGFTEAARNFQVDNFGRGGVGNDAVKAEGQDYSGTNNANFLTPADGTSGRMQMYIFPGPNPDRTSGIDHDVLLHELTHGTSNRLHNNGSGLGTAMSGGMGEGWSDFYARALLSDASESVSGVYPTGGWVTNLLSGGFTDNYYYGIRRFPYAVMSTVGGPMNRPHNPLTFADIDPAQINTTDGAYARSPIIGNTANEVHNVGEVWSMALLEVRARFITRLGFAVGNQRFLQFVTDGMKLDPVNPTLLQGRDAILAAAVAGGNLAADIADIWAGFAVRGMGVSAQVVSGFTVVEAFDAPGIAAGTATLVSESIPNGRIDPGETVGVSFCIVNNGSSTSGAVTGTLQSGGGVTSPSTAQGYGAIPVAATVCRTFTFTASVACGATINATLSAAWGGQYIDDFIDRGRVKRVMLQADAPFRMVPDDFNRWSVRNNAGEMVPFAAFGTSSWDYGSPRLERYNGVPAMQIQGEAKPGESSGEAMAEVERLVAQLPAGFDIEWTGLSYQERESGSQTPLLYTLSLLIVFLCLAALYESWTIPTAVLMIVPLGILGTALASTMRGMERDVYFQVAMLTTVGLTSKNAILIVEFAKANVVSGMELINATMTAVRDRLRPILMTSLAFGLGVMPLAIANGAGSGAQRAIGTGVLGGMILGTLLGLFFIPLFFVVIERLFDQRKKYPVDASAVALPAPAAAPGDPGHD